MDWITLSQCVQS